MRRRRSEIDDKDIKILSVDEEFDWGSLVVPSFAVLFLVLGIAFLSTIFIRSKLEGQIKVYLAHRPEGELTYQSMKLSVIWDNLEIRGIEFKPKGQRDSVKIRKLVVKDIGREVLFKISRKGLTLPQNFKLEIYGLYSSTNVLSFELARAFHELGYKDVRLNLAATIAIQPRTARMQISNGIMDLNDAGRLKLAMSVDRFIFPTGSQPLNGIFTPGGMVDSNTWRMAELKLADVQFHNNKLVERLALRASNRRLASPFSMFGIQPRMVASSSIDFASMTAKKLSELKQGSRVHFRAEPFIAVPMRDIRFSVFQDLVEAQKKLGLSILAK